MKKLIDDPDDVVVEALRGLGAAHADLVRVDLENRLVIRRDAAVSGKVALVSGGGSGHEPLHGGSWAWYARRGLRGGRIHLAGARSDVCRHAGR